tara:strand:+ start:16671 stop:17033 length:363 start_codon:yes stop_codon:yes gene_type:complete
MLYFGSRNFGQANFGKGLITTSVDESQPTSNMDVAGYIFFNTSVYLGQSVADTDVASGLVQGAFLKTSGTGTTIASGIKMFWHPQLPTTTATTDVDVSAKLAWDGQQVPETTWTTQIVGD